VSILSLASSGAKMPPVHNRFAAAAANALLRRSSRDLSEAVEKLAAAHPAW